MTAIYPIHVFIVLLVPWRLAQCNYALGEAAPMCWKLDAKNTPITCPAGLQIDWVPSAALPRNFAVSMPVNVNVSVNMSLATLEDMHNQGVLSANTSLTPSEKWAKCAQQQGRCTDPTKADECCYHHINAHSCLDKPGTFCGPWVANDGHLATHTPAFSSQAGREGRGVFSFPIKLFWEGSYTVIIHIRFGGMHYAIGRTTTVTFSDALCPMPLVPGKTGACQACPNGTQPLSLGIPKGSEKLTDTQALALNVHPLCVPCPPGWYSPCGAECLQATPGHYTNESWLLAEIPCSAGAYNPLHAMIGCIQCSPGEFQAEAGATSCRRCPRASFSNNTGSSACTACPHGKTTDGTGFADSSACTCPPATFESMVDGNACPRCPPELSCAGGSEAPKQVKGFWVDIADHAVAAHHILSIYRCRNARECPSGLMGTCASGREGRSCNNCKLRHYKQHDGTCGECQGADIAITIIVCVLIFGVALSGFTFFRGSVEKQRLTTASILMIVGQFSTTVQSLGATSLLSIDFPMPARSIMDAMRVFVNIDLDIIRITCIMPKDSPVVKFALQLLTYPFVLSLVSASWLIAHKFNRGLSVDVFFNMNGLILIGLFITLTLTVVLPFQCRSNPCGIFSMLSNPGVTCWQSDEHMSLVALGIFGALVYPVSILAWTTWAVVTHPQRISSGRGIERARRYRFLFNRFRSERYYYGLLYLIRNTLVALVPVLLVRVIPLQVLAMATVIAGSAVLQARLWPWRTPAANVSDLLSGLALNVMLTAAAALVETSTEDKEQVLGVLVFLIILVLFAVATAALMFSIFRRFRPAAIYHVFLCHHKGGAGVLARFIKMVLTRTASARVFLDSDQLEDLELIFDTVRSATANVVVLMTADVLFRMWCAGEIATAVQNSVPIVPVELNGFVKVDTDGIKNICTLWTEGERHQLADLGIHMEMIVKAYECLMILPVSVLNRRAPQQEQEVSVLGLAGRCKVQISSMLIVGCYSLAHKPRVLVTGAASDAEVFSTCMVVQLLIQSQLQVATVVVRDADHFFEVAACGSVGYVLILLSKGMLLDTPFALMLWEIHIARIEIVTASTNDGFQFPSADFYYQIEADGIEEIIASFGEGSKKELANAYRSLLRVLALPLSPLGSQGLLEKQVSDISRRFKRLQHGGDQLERQASMASSKTGRAVQNAGGDKLENQSSKGLPKESIDPPNDSKESIDPLKDSVDKAPAVEAASLDVAYFLHGEDDDGTHDGEVLRQVI